MENSNRYISSSKTKEQGRGSYYKMLNDARQGELTCIKRGVYVSDEQLADTMIDVDSIVPNGILCSFSAWNINELTTSLPQAFHIAIKRGRKVVVPQYPAIELHHYSESIIQIGVEQRVVSGYQVMIYNAERCVCDAIKFRNNVGIDVCSEIINNYLLREDRNLTLLMEYAEKLRVANTLKKYLEVKL